MKLKFTIPGVPVGKGRPRFSTAGRFPRAYTPEKTAHYENLVKLAAQTAMGDAPPFHEAASVCIMAWFPIPASWSKKKQEAARRGLLLPTVKPDTDNMAKVICDAMNGIVWRDDAQVATLFVGKLYGQTPGVTVEVTDCGLGGQVESGNPDVTVPDFDFLGYPHPVGEAS